MAEAEGIKIENLQKLKELEKMDGIDNVTYMDAVEKYKSEKNKHSAGIRFYGGNPESTRAAVHGFGS